MSQPVSIEKIELPNGVTELNIRTGEAAVLEPGRRISIAGNIYAPSKFLTNRKPAPKKCHAIVSKADRSILLQSDEILIYGGHTIKGQLVLAKEIAEFQINGTKRFSHKELMDLLKRFSYIFEDRERNKELIQQLQSFKITVNKTVEDIDNQKGSVKKLTEWKAADDITFSFKIKYPIYSGDEPSVFNVEACLDVSDRDVQYYLVSGELNELLETRFQSIVAEQVKMIEDHGVVVITQ